MIQKVAFTSQPVVTPTKNVNFAGSEIVEEKKENSALLYGSLAALGALGLGLVLHKPKVVEKEIVKTVEKTTEQVQKTALKKVKSKTRARKNLNIAGKERHMDKADAKWQRKRNKQIINEQIQREAQESFTEQELQTYRRKNGYKKPTQKQQNDIDNLHAQNAQQRAQTNTVGNLAQQQKPKPPKSPVENPELKGIEGTINNLKKRIAGAKRFGKDTSKLEAQLNSLIEKRNNIAQVAERKN